VFKELLLHQLVLNVDAVSLHERYAEPLRAKSFLLNEHALSQARQLHFDCLLLLFSDLKCFALIVLLPGLKVGILVLAHWWLLAPYVVMEPYQKNYN